MDRERGKVAVHVLILVLLSLFFFFWKIGDLNLFGTEAHRALPAQTMLKTHDWWVPKLYGEPYLTKPPLTYWLICIFSIPQGKVTEVSARLPSAFCASVLVLLIYWFARRQLGGEAGILSALIALTTGLIFEKAISAEIDMNLTLWITASLLFVYKALDRTGRSPAWVFGAYIFLSMAFLSKGPPALIFFYATLVSFLVWEKRLRFLWSFEHILAFLMFVVLSFSWVAVVVSKIGWAELSGTSHGELLSRVASSTSLRISDTFYYPAGIMAGFFPWSLFLPIAFLPSYYRSLDADRRRLQRFLYCGVALNLVLFSAVAGKSNRYLLPIYPLMVLMVGMLWHDLIKRSLSEAQERYLKAVCGVVFGAFACGTVGFIVIKTAFDIPQFPTSVLFYVGLAGVSIIAFLFSRKSRYGKVLVCILLIFSFYKLIFAFDYASHRNRRRSIQHIASGLNAHIPSNDVIYTFSFRKPHIFFYLHNPVVKLADISHIYEKTANDLTTYCLLTEQELRLLREQYSASPRPLYDFNFQKNQIALVALDAGETKVEEYH